MSKYKAKILKDYPGKYRGMHFGVDNEIDLMCISLDDQRKEHGKNYVQRNLP